MTKVLPFTGFTTQEIPPDQILEKAMGKLDTVVLLGYDKDGEEYFASSDPDGGTALWLFERAKKKLMHVGEQDD